MTIASVLFPGSAVEDWIMVWNYRKLRYADLSELQWYYRGPWRSTTIAKTELPRLSVPFDGRDDRTERWTSSSSPSSACIRTSVSTCGTLALKEGIVGSLLHEIPITRRGSNLIDVLMDVVRPSTPPGLLRHDDPVLRRHRLRFQLPLSLFGRIFLGHQIARPGVNERGLRVVRLPDSRRALQDVVLGAQQLLEPLVALLTLGDVGHIPSRSRGHIGWWRMSRRPFVIRHSLLLMILLSVLLISEIQLRVQVETQPLSEQRDTVFGAGRHRGDQLVGVQSVFLLVRVVDGLRRLRDAAWNYSKEYNKTPFRDSLVFLLRLDEILTRRPPPVGHPGRN